MLLFIANLVIISLKIELKFIIKGYIFSGYPVEYVISKEKYRKGVLEIREILKDFDYRSE